MQYVIDVMKRKQEFSSDEKTMINDIFGLFVKNVYFSMKAKIDVKNTDKIINFAGISGVGKTIIKDEIKRQTLEQLDVEVMDFDDLESNWIGENILSILNITTSDDPIIKLLSGFGMFEMRILMQKYETLSQGQKTRLKYIYMFNNVSDKETYILIDEFLTFVDDLSAISFAQNIEKFLSDKNVKLFTFGVNFNIIGQFEDVTFVLGNSTITSVIRNNKIEYLHDKLVFDDVKIEPLIDCSEVMNDW